MSFLGKNKDKEDELIQQLKILNTLIFLDAQYHNTDSIMTMKEIQDEYIKVGHKLLKENKKWAHVITT